MKNEKHCERNLPKALIWLAIATGLIILLALCGCASFWDNLNPEGVGGLVTEVLDDYRTNRVDDAESPAQPDYAKDAVRYADLQWRYGGFNGAGADFDQVTLSNASCNGKRYAYTFDVGMSAWGIAHGDAGHTICAVFVEQDGGQWVGGKFDWVSTSRTFRDLHHVESYNNWPSSGWKLPLRGKVAFVIVHKDRARRSNVIMAEAR